MSSLLEKIDDVNFEGDYIEQLFKKCKCKPRASSVGTESQSSESQSNSQQYLADNFRDQNLNHQHTSSGGGLGVVSSSSSRQSSRRHSSSGFAHQQQQQQQQLHHSQQQQYLNHLQQLPDNLLKHSKHSSYPPLLTTELSPSSTPVTSNNTTFIVHGSLSPYDNNNVSTNDIVGVGNSNKSESRRSSSHHNGHHHHNSHHHHSSSRYHHSNHLQQQQQQSDSSDNFPVTQSFPTNNTPNYSNNSSAGGTVGGGSTSNNSSSGCGGNNKKIEGHTSNHYANSHNNHHGSGNSIHHNSGSSNSITKAHHHHTRSKNSISSRNSRHEAAVALAAAFSSASSGGTGSAQNNSQSQNSGGRHHSRSSHHSHHNSSGTERPHHHHRSKKLTQMTESSSCEPISPVTVNKSTRYNNKSQKSNLGGESGVGIGGSSINSSGPTKSYSTLSLGSGMECEPIDDHHHHHYDDSFCTTRTGRNLTTSNGAPSQFNSEHSIRTSSNNLPGNGSCLRDSRIEIAGGREIYSQNRIRAGRRLRGSSSTSSSTEMMADSSISMTASSSSSAGTKSRRKSPNVQQQSQILPQQHQQSQQLVCTNGDDMMDDGGSAGEISVWEPKHSKSYPDNGVLPRAHHHSSGGGHRHHGSQHHHHSRQHHHHSQHHHHTRNRHVCAYPHYDHTKVLSPTEMSPASMSGPFNSKSGGPDMSLNSNSANTTQMTVKETVFSTEITSIEKPIDPEQSAKRAAAASAATTTGAMQSPYVYETTVNESGGEIIFDDIGSNWDRNNGRGGAESTSRMRKESTKRSPSSGSTSGSNIPGGKPSQQQLNFFHSSIMGDNEGSSGGGSGMQCCSSLEQMNHSGSSMNASSAPTVLLQGSPSPSTRGGNTTPSGYESDEYSGVTPVSLSMMGYGSNSNSGSNSNNSGGSGGGGKGCLPNNRLIGAVPIAEYEGSPKRYGLRQPTHPMTVTHLDLVDVDIQMDSGSGVRSPSEIINSSSGSGASSSGVGSHHNHHVVSLMSPSQAKPAAVIPTTASSSSSSSLDNTNSAASSTSSSNHHHSHSHHGSHHHHHHNHHRTASNLYSSRISPSVISPSQSVSSFPSRVPGFPQRITPVTSSLDSSSLIDSGLDKSEATDVTKSDNVLELTEVDRLVCHQTSINNDECSQQQQQQQQQQHQLDQIKLEYQQHQQQQQQQQQHHQISNHHHGPSRQESNAHHHHQQHSLRSSDIDEPPSSMSLCQGQLVNSDHSSDLLLTDQLNLKAEKCTPSNTTNLCGNPLDDNQQMRQPPQQHQMVLELVDSAVTALENHHPSLSGQQQPLHHHPDLIPVTGDSSNTVNDAESGAENQCLISVPSTTDSQQQRLSTTAAATIGSGGITATEISPGGAADGHNSLLGIGGTSSCSTDYLYEFSETRKVLEEFFGNSNNTGTGGSGVGGLDNNNPTGAGVGSSAGAVIGLDGNSSGMMSQGPFFDDLDYTLKRQAGNSYVGQRLAGESCSAVEESPKKPARRGVLLLGSSDGDGADGCDAASPRLISFQEITLPQLQQHQQQQQQKSIQNPPRDLNDNDIDGDTSSSNTETDNLGDTEVGLQVGLSRNFTLSPETTDCDSNELESEISLDYEASLHSSSRVGASMPAVEDGLSSGNVSDAEDQLVVPASDQINNDLKRAQQHSLLCSSNNTPGSNSNNPCISKQSSTQQQRRELQQPPSSHHQHHQHQPQHFHLSEDGLGCNGASSGTTTAAGLSSAAVSSSAQSSSASLYQQLQQQLPGSPNSSSSNAKIPSEPNPTLLLMKKQISEIEKEIKMRASQQNQKSTMQLQQHHSIDNGMTPLNNSTPRMSITDTDGNNSGNGNNDSGGSTNNISSLINNGGGSGGSSCATSNGNGLASQLNVSSCPDVSTLSTSNTLGGGSAGQGSSSCYSQQQLSTGNGPSNNNINNSLPHHRDSSLPLCSSNNLPNNISSSQSDKGQETTNFDSIDIELEALDPMRPTPPPSPAPSSLCQPQTQGSVPVGCASNSRSSASSCTPNATSSGVAVSGGASSTTGGSSKIAPAPPSINIPAVSGVLTGSNSNGNGRLPGSSTVLGEQSNTSVISPDSSSSSSSVAAAIQDIKEAIQRTKTLPRQQSSHVETSRPSPLTSASQSHADAQNSDTSPVWVPRQGSYHHHRSGSGGAGVKDPLLRKQRYDETPDDDADTDQETDRLLGQTRTEDDYGFYDEKEWKKSKNCRSLLPALNKGVSFVKSAATGSVQPLGLSTSASSLNTGGGSVAVAGSNTSNNHGVPSYSSTSNTIAPSSARISPAPFKQQEPLPSSQLNSSSSNNANNISNKPKKEKDGIKKKRSKEDFNKNPSVLIEGVLFRARYLGSTQLVCEGQPTKATRMMQAEEAVSRIKTQVDQSDLSSETEPLGTHNVSSDSAEPIMHTNTSTSTSSASTTIATATTTTTSSSSSSAFTSNNNDKGEQAAPQFEDYLYAEDDDSGDESCTESEFFHKGHHTIQSPTSSARSFQGPCFGGTSPGEPGTLPPSAHFGPACGSALPGTMFRLKFIGSLEVDEEVGSGKRRRKRPKKTMVEEAVLKMKAPEGETQPSTEVDLFISTEKIMVLNTDLKEIMMDHALRTISYIADIGDLVVLMARRRPVPSDTPDDSKIARPPKMICHVFESDEAQYIAQSIGQAFQVAYMEFLKANGIEDQSFVREMDYQEVLNSQEIFGDELQMFAKKELQKEVVVPKSKGEILGVVIVESGWGSMLPTVVIANLAPSGAAARCGQLNIGDQIIAINGVSLVGLPLSTCQNYIKNTKSQTVVKLTVVPCPPVVEVKIKRPDTKYQLGFSVQNGVICSLLRGGIAERGGVRVGHRIIEINGQSVVAVPHEKIVNLLATSVGEINMKTMPTSMFRLLTGQETPLYI